MGENTWRFGYDAVGNLISKTLPGETWTYAWDALNQLVEVKHGTSVGNATSVATCAYDPIGRRIRKETPTKTVGDSRSFARMARVSHSCDGSPWAAGDPTSRRQ
ncbi:MAG: RHS repeat protein [Vicinamibacteria bacterium]|nr:RHS repeat protein [Vicinamibacteria bacterium]